MVNNLICATDDLNIFYCVNIYEYKWLGNCATDGTQPNIRACHPKKGAQGCIYMYMTYILMTAAL